MAGLSERRRARAIERLQHGYACGSISTQTFERRVDETLRATDGTALRQATTDGRTPTRIDRLRARLERLSAAHPSDLGSTNGTFVNGHVVKQAEVMPGDHVRLGAVWIIL